MPRVVRYKCPRCGATKEIRDLKITDRVPVDLPCAVRGCKGRAMRVDD